jgi:hypothetical protein
LVFGFLVKKYIPPEKLEKIMKDEAWREQRKGEGKPLALLDSNVIVYSMILQF